MYFVSLLAYIVYSYGGRDPLPYLGNFFAYVASLFQEYLITFQTEAPEKILRNLMKMFIDRKMFYQTNTALKIVKIDTSKKR